MSRQDIIRAWKDEDYRASLSEAERNSLPKNPAGFIELTDDDLQLAAGAGPTSIRACEFTTATCRMYCDL